MEDRAAWLKAERRKQRITQEKLAAMASVSVRTVQRAEDGQRMSDEVWKDFEAALGSTPTLARRRETRTDRYRQFKTLRRARSAKDFLDALALSSVAKLDYDVEPTSEILSVLKRSIEFIEARLPRPWSEHERLYRPSSLVQRLEDETACNEIIDQLHGIGAAIFYATEWIQVIYPKDGYECGPYVDHNQPPEGRYLLQAVISASEKDRELFPEVYDWGVEVAADQNDDVPF